MRQRGSRRYVSCSSDIATRVRRYVHACGEIAVETVWPTRCIVCGRPGDVLCPECETKLPYLDLWSACPVCGAAYGLNQCVECSTFSLAQKGIDALPYQGCVSSVRFVPDVTGKIVRGSKDMGERRLIDVMGRLIAQAVPPEWTCRAQCIVYVPASKKAMRTRGFDHGKALGDAVARRIGLPCLGMLERPTSHDQRKLSRRGRFVNMQHRFTARGDAMGQCKPHTVILVDDVYTTGATLCAASCALVEGGVQTVLCATFARV